MDRAGQLDRGAAVTDLRTVAPEMRRRLIQLLTDELIEAWNAAVAIGATPVELATVLEERRWAIGDFLSGPRLPMT